MKPVWRKQNKWWKWKWHTHEVDISKCCILSVCLYKEINIEDGFKVCAHLHATIADLFKGSGHALDKLDDLVEAIISNTPWTINEEDHVCLGPLANYGAGTTVLTKSLISAQCKYYYLSTIIRMTGLFSPSSEGGNVAGGGGVGGSVGTSVGLTTARQNRNKCEQFTMIYYTVDCERIFVYLQNKLEVTVASMKLASMILHVLSFTLTPGPSRLGVWTNTVAS